MELFQTKNYRLDEEICHFLYGISIQPNNTALYNFIATSYNTIVVKELRKISIHEWISGIKYLYSEYEKANSHLFVEVLKGYFIDGVDLVLNSEFAENMIKARVILDNIQSVGDILLIGDGGYDKSQFTNYFDYYAANGNYKKYDPNLEFSDYPEAQQVQILEIYGEYLKAYEEQTNNKDGFVEWEAHENSIYTAVLDSIEKNYLTNANKELLKSFFQLFKEDKTKGLSDAEIINHYNEHNALTTNLTISSYFIHYILSSLSVPTSTDLTACGVAKMTGKQTDIIQRLLCAVTTKNTDIINNKANNYYVAFNKLFKFGGVNDATKDKVLEHLVTVRTLLLKYGLNEAVKTLDSDYKKITYYKNNSTIK